MNSSANNHLHGTRGRYASRSSARRLPALALCGFAVTRLLVFSSGAAQPDLAAAQRFTTLAGAPLYFEPNQGQSKGAAQFIAQGRDCSVLLAPAEAALVLSEVGGRANGGPMRSPDSEGEFIRTRTVRFRLEGANVDAPMIGLNELPGRANYFIGNRRSAWRLGVPLFSRVQVEAVYPGIQLAYYCAGRQLEYDFLLQPGASPDEIALRIEGADGVHLDAAGNLVLKLGKSEIRQHKPVIYQWVNGVRKPVAGGYRLRGDATVGFQVADYNPARPLVIDPVLSFSTYLGGQFGDKGWSIALDDSGNIYVAGETVSPDLPTTPGALMDGYQGGTKSFGDAFVAKYSITTNAAYGLQYLTYLGGKGQDAAFALAVDAKTGNAYVTGYTDSTNFPLYTTNPVLPPLQTVVDGTNNNGRGVYPIDAFVTGLDSSGSNLIFSTYLGGIGRDTGLGIALDGSNYVYVTGYTESSNFPTFNGLQGLYVGGRQPNTVTNYFGANYHGNGDAFVSKITPDGTALAYSSYLGGTNVEYGETIAVDAAGCAHVAGLTASTNFPTTDPLALHLNGVTGRSTASDGFISTLSADGQSLLHSAYLGGSDSDVVLAVALDTETNCYVAGYTFSTNFPIYPRALTNNFQGWASLSNYNSDVFVTKFNPDGTTNYSIVFGGRAADYGTALAVSGIGEAYVAGVTSSTNLFTPSLFQTAPKLYGGLSPTNSSVKKYGTNDAFVAALSPAGSNFAFAAYLGGSGNDQANGIAVDPAGNAYLAGMTGSTNFPTVDPLQARVTNKRNTNDVFIAKIYMDSTPLALSITSTNSGLLLSWPGFSPELTLESNTNLLSPGGWTSVGKMPRISDNWESVVVPGTNASGFFRLHYSP